MANKVNRRKSRTIAMELLYSGAVNERDGEITDDFLDEFSSISDTTDVLDKNYIRQIVELAEAREGYFRKVLTPFLKDWDIKRISRINLAILRISVTELLYMKDIPPRVSVNEAIELAKTYSDEESAAFINGVLDKVLKAIQNDAIPEWTEEMEAAEPAGHLEELATGAAAGGIPEELSGSLPEDGTVEPEAVEPEAAEPAATESQGVEHALDPAYPDLTDAGQDLPPENDQDQTIGEPAEEILSDRPKGSSEAGDIET